LAFNESRKAPAGSSYAQHAHTLMGCRVPYHIRPRSVLTLQYKEPEVSDDTPINVTEVTKERDCDSYVGHMDENATRLPRIQEHGCFHGIPSKRHPLPQ
jgi:hypothetical protein